MFRGKTFQVTLPGNSYRIFIEGLKSPVTKAAYSYALQKYMNHLNIRVCYGQNSVHNCDAVIEECSLQLDNIVEIRATGASEVNADIDVKLNGQNNCDPDAVRCSLELGRTIEIIANDGEVVNVDYQDNVEYVQNCGAGEICEHRDVKLVTCTVTGCVVTDVPAQAVLESQDVIETDQESIVMENTLQAVECTDSAECPSSSPIIIPVNDVEAGAAAEVIPIDSTISGDSVTNPSLISTTSSTPTAITDPSQSTVDSPLETTSVIAQEEEQQPPETLKKSSSEAADTVATDTTVNNANVGSDDIISSTAEVDTDDNNNIENVEEVDDKSTDSPDSNTDDSGTTNSPDDADDNEDTESSGEDNDTTDNSDGDESTESDDSSGGGDNNSESDNDSGESGDSGNDDDDPA
jgi:hypothetical protein